MVLCGVHTGEQVSARNYNIGASVRCFYYFTLAPLFASFLSAFHPLEACMSQIIRESFKLSLLLLLGLKHIFSHGAQRANPIVWDILKGCPRRDARIRISHSRVIDITTNGANILFHPYCLLFFFSAGGAHLVTIIT